MTSERLDEFIAHRAKAANISSKSLLVTILGDVLAVHGDWIWLGSLIDGVADLGFSDRLVRTSVFRLVQDNWLTTKKVGRRSYYGLTETAKLHNQKAQRRIYAAHTTPWNGRWLLVMPTFVQEPQLSEFRKQLAWLGFSPLASGVYAHPSFDQQSLEETLHELDLKASVVIFSSQTLTADSGEVLKRLVHDHWNIPDLALAYQHFLDDYRWIYQSLITVDSQSSIVTDRQAFLLRVLIIHEYRRILLKDHELPQDMLPSDWQGEIAHQWVKDLYAYLAKPSIDYIRGHLRNIDGELPQEEQGFWQRF